MKRYCLTLDLIDDPELISAYEAHHEAVWPKIITSIKSAGISDMEIYRFRNRLFMIMETEDGFTFENKKLLDDGNEIVKEWEQMLWKYQQQLPGAAAGEKWILMNNIFDLTTYQ